MYFYFHSTYTGTCKCNLLHEKPSTFKMNTNILYMYSSICQRELLEVHCTNQWFFMYHINLYTGIISNFQKSLSFFLHPIKLNTCIHVCATRFHCSIQSVYLIPPPQKFVITDTHNDKNVRSSPASVPDAGSSSPAWHTSSCTWLSPGPPSCCSCSHCGTDP